jgi:hypothetical protein
MGRRHPGIRTSGILGSQANAKRLFESLSAHPKFEVEQLDPQLRRVDFSPSARLSKEPPDVFVARLKRTFAFFEGALNDDPKAFE